MELGGEDHRLLRGQPGHHHRQRRARTVERPRHVDRWYVWIKSSRNLLRIFNNKKLP